MALTTELKLGICWDRLFTTVSGDGQPKSYFQYFLIALAGYFAFDYFRKKKEKAINNFNPILLTN